MRNKESLVALNSLFIRINKERKRITQQYAEPLGLTMSQVMVLQAANDHPGSIQKELSCETGIATTVLVGILVADLIAAPIGAAAAAVGTFVRWATVLQPFFMGILVSVVIGVALTLPISSAAICAALSLTGLAGGAAVAGCCAQMVGFAVMSFKENRWGGLVAQGVGTSMLQMPNIVKNPKIWIPPTLASAITGPLATCLFKLEMNGTAVSSGMGTCGFVGQIGVYTGWVNDVASGAKAAITGMDWAGMVLICFVLPAVLSWVFCEILRKKGWIKENDLKLDL